MQLDDELRQLLLVLFRGELAQRLKKGGDILHAAAVLEQQEDLADGFRRLQHFHVELFHEELRELLVGERRLDVALLARIVDLAVGKLGKGQALLFLLLALKPRRAHKRMVTHAALRADDFLVPTGAVEHHAHEGGEVKALPLFEISVDHGEKLVVIEKAVVEEKSRRETHDFRIEPRGVLVGGRIELFEYGCNLLGHVPAELALIRADRHNAEPAEVVEALIVIAEVIGEPVLFPDMAESLILLLERRRQPALGKLHGGGQQQIDELGQGQPVRLLKTEVVRHIVKLLARKTAQSLLQRALFRQGAAIKPLPALLFSCENPLKSCRLFHEALPSCA